MDFSFVSYSAAISILTLLLVTKLLSSNSSNKNHKPLPPSPGPSLPILGHLHLLSKPLHRSLAHLSSRHASPALLFRFGFRPVLVVSSLPLAEECFTANDLAFANRPQLPSNRSHTYNFTTLSFSPYGPHWRNVRRIATVHLLSSARLLSLSHVRSHEIKSLLHNLFNESKEKESFMVVELKPRLFGVAYNVMMRMIAGKRYYGEGSEEAMRFRELVEETLAMIGVSNVSDFVPALRLVDLGGVKGRLRRLEETKDVVMQGLIDEQRRKRGSNCDGGEETEKEKKKNMLEVLMDLQEEDPEYYTDEIIKAMIVTLFFAGTETSSETMEWAMTLLLNHPESLVKARDEIQSRIGEGRLLQEHDLPNLPYLNAIISETLRLCPPTPLLLPHESLDECTVGGYRIPSGTMLLVNAWAIHRDPAEWADPAEFRPERFVDGGGGGGGGGDGGKFLPFGMGRRRCPGDGLAKRVIGLALGTMIQCFEWKRIGEELIDMEETGGLTLHKANPLQVMYRPCQAMLGVLSQI